MKKGIETLRYHRRQINTHDGYYRAIISPRDLQIKEFRAYFGSQLTQIQRFKIQYRTTKDLKYLINTWLQDTAVILTGIEHEDLLVSLDKNLYFDNELKLLIQKLNLSKESIICQALNPQRPPYPYTAQVQNDPNEHEDLYNFEEYIKESSSSSNNSSQSSFNSNSNQNQNHKPKPSITAQRAFSEANSPYQ